LALPFGGLYRRPPGSAAPGSQQRGATPGAASHDGGCQAVPGDNSPPGWPGGKAAQRPFGWSDSHGNGKLWVGGLWPHGVIVASGDFIQQDGPIYMKFGWWRKVAGALTITGRRLDAPAPPLTASVPSGYGDTGFQASGFTSLPKAAGRSPGRSPAHLSPSSHS
jgi:hypothetical protein